MKMNAEQIIRLMSCLTGGIVKCDECLFGHVELPLCRSHLAEAAVDMLKKLTRENEGLRKINKTLYADMKERIDWLLAENRRLEELVREQETAKACKWKLGESGCIYHCNQCHYAAHPREVDEWKYCPKCGARMDGGNDD